MPSCERDEVAVYHPCVSPGLVLPRPRVVRANFRSKSASHPSSGECNFFTHIYESTYAKNPSISKR